MLRVALLLRQLGNSPEGAGAGSEGLKQSKKMATQHLPLCPRLRMGQIVPCLRKTRLRAGGVSTTSLWMSRCLCICLMVSASWSTQSSVLSCDAVTSSG